MRYFNAGETFEALTGYMSGGAKPFVGRVMLFHHRNVSGNLETTLFISGAIKTIIRVDVRGKIPSQDTYETFDDLRAACQYAEDNYRHY